MIYAGMKDLLAEFIDAARRAAAKILKFEASVSALRAA